MKKLASLLIITLVLSSFTGCFLKKSSNQTSKTQKIELTMYGLFDDSDIYKPLIQEYQSNHSNVTITYKQFTDPETYLDLIINELAEGEGPDIFAMHNSWIYEHYKKVAPAPASLETAQEFESTFVSAVSDDFLRVDSKGNYEIYGMPMYVDTIALYYNEDQLEDAIPSRGKPANTWSGIVEDVYKLTKADNSFERFEVAGIAMGRADNIQRATDILYTLFLQYGVEFYNDDYTSSTITASQLTDLGTGSPGEQALDLYTSFAVPSNKNYSWNSYISDSESVEKELQAFVEGKVSMIFGYSYLYETLLNLIDTTAKTGTDTIDPSAIKVVEIPQVFDPETSTEKRDVYASYFAYSASRTSENPVAAWEFIEFLSSKENQKYYFEETHKPSSRRDLLEDQMKDPTYGVFATQVGYAETIPVADAAKFEEILSEAIESVIDTIKVKSALSIAEQKINAIMPEDGLFPELFGS
ncbi:MAG: extracellular solute-binding protein [Patescibacteria group bacterium]|nr:extracellular solute-binding protein [Patescibacteria group bacterium]